MDIGWMDIIKRMDVKRKSEKFQLVVKQKFDEHRPDIERKFDECQLNGR
jgi:hypothetical protein